MAYDDLRDLQVHCADLANFFNNLTAYGELSASV
jgi:hypothetical protein